MIRPPLGGGKELSAPPLARPKFITGVQAAGSLPLTGPRGPVRDVDIGIALCGWWGLHLVLGGWSGRAQIRQVPGGMLSCWESPL
jgi:hypothetical protein